MKAWLPEICLGLSLAAMMPMMAIQAAQLWERPHLQFFPLAWIALVVFIVKRAKVAWTDRLWRVRLGVMVWILGLGSGLVSALIFSPWFAQLACILFTIGWGLCRLEIPTTRLLGWSLLLWVTLPLPGNLDTRFIQRLQAVSSESASALLDLMGLPHLRQGNLIEIRAGQLFVDEACSGVDSLYSLIAISLLMMLWQKRPLVVGALTVLSVPVWAWLGNVIRLTLIVWFLDRWQIDLSHGTKHTILGLFTFAISSGCLFLTLDAVTSLFNRFPSSAIPRDRRLWHLWYNTIVMYPGKLRQVETEEDEYFSAAPGAQKSKVKAPPPKLANASSGYVWSKSVFVTLILGPALLGIFCGWIMVKNRTFAAAIAAPRFEEAKLDQAFSEAGMPASIMGATRVAYTRVQRAPNSFHGEHSCVWRYRNNQNELTLSVDFPFRGFHPLWVCYTNTGHEVLGEPELLPLTFSSGGALDAEANASLISLKDDLGGHAYVWFTLFDAEGRVVDIGDYQEKSFIAERLARANPMSSQIDPVTYQFQMHLASGRPLTEDELSQYFKLYESAIPAAVDQVKLLNQSVDPRPVP